MRSTQANPSTQGAKQSHPFKQTIHSSKPSIQANHPFKQTPTPGMYRNIAGVRLGGPVVADGPGGVYIVPEFLNKRQPARG